VVIEHDSDMGFDVNRVGHESVSNVIRLAGQRIRQARSEKKWTRQELSRHSGVSQRYLAHLESGEGNTSLGLLYRVACALDVSVEALVRVDDPMSTEVAEMSVLYRRADDAIRADVRQLLGSFRHPGTKGERICLIGLRGAGKSTLGGRLARDLDLPFMELNHDIEAIADMPVAEIFDFYGLEGYRRLEAQALSAIVSNSGRLILAAGGGIVSEQSTWTTLMAHFHTVWIKASPVEHMERVRVQGDLRPMAGNAFAMTQLLDILKSRESAYSRAEYVLDTSGKSVETSQQELYDLVVSNKLLGTSCIRS